MWWQGTMRHFSRQQCKSNQRMAQYRAMGERNNIFSPSKEGNNWWNHVLIKILIAVGRHPSRAADPCIAQSPAAMHIYTAPCRSLPIEKKIPMATYSSFMMGVHNSIYKNYLFHINTCIWTHKLWICGRYHRCYHWIFFSADHASQELLRQPQWILINSWYNISHVNLLP